jgi:MFS family permease
LSVSSAGQQYRSNITRYFVYKALQGFAFGPFGALWVIFLTQHRSMSLAEAALVDVTFFIAAAVGEVPTGVVADTWGRKTSLACGSALMTLGCVGWAFAPTMPLIMLSYIGMGIGFTFLSGADEALFYESVQFSGRGDDYARLVGRSTALFTGALAISSVLGGFLAEINLVLPFAVSGVALVLMLGVVLTLTEPRSETHDEKARPGFGTILRQSLALMRARPALRYPMLYLALVPLAGFVMEIIFLQPQAVALGVPIAGIGVLSMGLQLVNIAASSGSDRIRALFGERRILYAAPLIILASIVLLGLLQMLPALLFVAVIVFVTAALRPLLLARIQAEVSDEVRATVLSMQSLMFTFLGAISQPSLAYVADQAGLPAAYFVLAGCMAVLIVVLLWVSRQHFPRPLIMAAQADLSAASIDA